MKKRFLQALCTVFFIIFISSNVFAQKPYEGVDVSKLKGFTVYVTLTDDDVKKAVEMGANTFRIMIMIDDLLNPPESYGECPSLSIDQEKIQNLVNLVDIIVNKYQATVILDRHETPGLSRWSGVKDFRLYWNNNTGECYQNILVDTWRTLPKYFNKFPVDKVIYELLNEPEPKANDWDGVENQENARIWNDLQDRLIQAVREVDKDRTIIAAPPYGWRSTSLSEWTPSETVLNDGKIAVTFHFYEPHQYTMQWEAWDGKREYLSYPSGRWNKEYLEKRLGLAKDFEAKYPNLPLAITEFSVMRTAPGALQYLSDIIEIFDREGWGWTYHTFREKEYFLSKGRPYSNSLWELRYGPPGRMELIKKAFSKEK